MLLTLMLCFVDLSRGSVVWMATRSYLMRMIVVLLVVIALFLIIPCLLISVAIRACLGVRSIIIRRLMILPFYDNVSY